MDFFALMEIKYSAVGSNESMLKIFIGNGSLSFIDAYDNGALNALARLF